MQNINDIGNCEPSHVLPDAMGSPQPQLKDQWSIQIKRGFGANMFHFGLPMLAKIVKTQTVLPLVDRIQQSLFEYRPLCWIDFDFEDGILHPLTIILAGFGDSA